jgi:hypothetical protein
MKDLLLINKEQLLLTSLPVPVEAPMKNIYVGFFFPILNGIAIRHLRNIFICRDLNMKILLHSSNKNLVETNFLKKNIITNDDIIFYDKNIIDLLNCCTIIIHCMNPDITKYLGSNNFDEKILNKIKSKIFYIHHGISSIYNIESIKAKNINYYKIWSHYVQKMNKYNMKFITACKHLINMLKHYNFNHNNLFKTKSLPQFDLNEKLKNTNKKYLNSIIIVIGENESLNTNNIKNIINVIKNNYPDKEIIIKFKFKFKFNNVIFDKNIKCYYENTSLFEFIDSYLIIVTSGGTSYFELLMYNNKVILFQPNSKLFYYDSYPFELKKLIIVDNCDLLDEKIKLLENNLYFDKEYELEIEKIKDFHVDKQINNFSDDFREILKNNN